MSPHTTAWAYLAVSSDAQAATLVDQERWARQTAAEKGWRITRIFGAGREGVATGKRGVRTHLAELIAELQRAPGDRRPSWLLMIRADRVGRGRIADSQIALHAIADPGVRIWTSDGGEFKIDGAVNEIISAVKSGLAALENEVKRDKALAHCARKRAANLPTSRIVPFGLRREGEHFVEDPLTGWVVREMDQRYLRGDTIAEILRWLGAAHPDAWGSHPGIHRALRDDAGYYTSAGLRSRDVQDALRKLARSRLRGSGRYGKRAHEFRGVFVCGKCVDLGFDAAASLMGAELVGYRSDRDDESLASVVVCQRKKGANKRHDMFVIRVARLREAWDFFTEALGFDDAVVENWARSAPGIDVHAKRRQVQRELSQLEQREAEIAAVRTGALLLAVDSDPDVLEQARHALRDVAASESEIYARREALHGELAATDVPARSADVLREALRNYGALYKSAPIARRNSLNRLLCEAVGSFPIVRRAGGGRWAPLEISWPAVLATPLIVAPDWTLIVSAGQRQRRRRMVLR